MCGIVGAIGPPVDPGLASRVLDGLRHRGPDDSGSLQRGEVWLGFRRLAILDLRPEAGQPMVDETSDVAIVFNGEVYNYLELRDRLERSGHRFRTTGDTEVLLAGYLEWGESVVERCNGMFAFAIHDPRRAGLLLGRDRFGEKPLHLGKDDADRWWFGSELRTVVTAGAGNRRPNLARVAGFLGLGDVEDPASSYVDGVDQVEPGTLITLSADGPASLRRWWNVGELTAARRDVGPEEIRELLGDAVRLRLRSDVEVGTSLSGGLDSSSIVATIRAVDGTRRVHAFTASFPGDPLDEWGYAEAVARRFDVRLHRVEPTVKGFLDQLDDLVERQGAPFESPTVYAQWCVMRAAQAEGVTVLLDGQGADETWGGYAKYVGFAWLDLLRRGRIRALRASVQRWRGLGVVPHPQAMHAGGLLAPAALRERVATAVASRGMGPVLRGQRVADPLGGIVGDGVLDRAARADLSRTLLPRLLRYADRNSMAWGREIRLPFLDPSLLAVALASGWAEGLEGGWTKHALRRAMAERLPKGIVWRRDKVAYQTPDEAWLRHEPLRDAIEVARRDLAARGLVVADGRSVPPWRALTLSRFLDRYGLR